MASETWRVVLADGSVRGVEVITDIVEGCPPEYSCGGECSTHSAHDAVVLWLGESLWPSGHMLVREILAPGEMTRAEALDAAERERDEARAEVDRLLEQVRVWRSLARDGSIASVDLGVIGSDEAAQAMARVARRASQHAEQGAVAERERCAEVAEAWLRDAKEITQDSPEELADAIRARGAR